MTAFKTETKHPFKELIDTLEEAVDKNFRTDEPEGQEFLERITGLIRLACYMEIHVAEPYSIDQVDARLTKEHIPYQAVYKVCTKSEDGYTAVPDSEYLMFTIKPCVGNADMITVRDHLTHYLRDMSEEPDIYAYEIIKELKAITRLYNMVYGPFYIKEPDRVYGTDEINVLMIHQRIPFFIRQVTLPGPLDTQIAGFSMKECRW